MKQQINNSKETWTYSKMRTIKQGWSLFFYTWKYTYPRLFQSTTKTNFMGEPLSFVYQEMFWLGLSGYEADV